MHERAKEKEMDRLRQLATVLRRAMTDATHGAPNAITTKPPPKTKKLRSSRKCARIIRPHRAARGEVGSTHAARASADISRARE
jgi:hypothetical protein